MVAGCPTSPNLDGNDDGTPAGSADVTDGNGDSSGDADDGSSATGGDQADGGTSDGQADDSGTDDGGGAADGSGGGDADGSGGAVTPVFTGTYSGQWDRTGQESLSGTPGPEEQWTTEETITFGADGIPTAFIVPGYRQTEGGIDFIAEVKQVGDTVTLDASADGMDYTLTITVAQADYGETSAHIILNLVHHGEGANDALTQDGTGVQEIEYDLQDGQLEYTSTTAYDVAWFYGSIDTTWDITCEGTLTPD
jgi:hypothetical protein